jgi:nucleotide-binding universal stress UspA family protein
MATVVVAYSGTPEAADGLALGRLLAELCGVRLAVAYVMPDVRSDETTDRATQHVIRERLSRLRATAEQTLPVGARFELWPAFGVSVAEGLDALTEDDVAMLVFGSTHHGPIGHTVLGDRAAAAVERATVPVAVAPRGLREHARIEPFVVGSAFDGSPESVQALRYAAMLAGTSGAALRVLAVDPEPGVAEELATQCERLGAEAVVAHGDVQERLTAETERLGLLVCGSRGRGALDRLIGRSVSFALMNGARCPLVVVPPRLAAATGTNPPSAIAHA